MLQGLVEADKGFSPDIFLVSLRLSCPICGVDHGQHCPFKVFFSQHPWQAQEPGIQPADVCDVFGDNIIAQSVKGHSLPQRSQFLVFDRDLQLHVDVQLAQEKLAEEHRLKLMLIRVQFSPTANEVEKKCLDGATLRLQVRSHMIGKRGLESPMQKARSQGEELQSSLVSNMLLLYWPNPIPLNFTLD